MSATYTWDIFSTLDGYGSYAEGADWGGSWRKQGAELLEHLVVIDGGPARIHAAAPHPEIEATVSRRPIEPPRQPYDSASPQARAEDRIRL